MGFKGVYITRTCFHDVENGSYALSYSYKMVEEVSSKMIRSHSRVKDYPGNALSTINNTNIASNINAYCHTFESVLPSYKDLIIPIHGIRFITPAGVQLTVVPL